MPCGKPATAAAHSTNTRDAAPATRKDMNDIKSTLGQLKREQAALVREQEMTTVYFHEEQRNRAWRQQKNAAYFRAMHRYSTVSIVYAFVYSALGMLPSVLFAQVRHTYVALQHTWHAESDAFLAVFALLVVAEVIAVGVLFAGFHSVLRRTLRKLHELLLDEQGTDRTAFMRERGQFARAAAVTRRRVRVCLVVVFALQVAVQMAWGRRVTLWTWLWMTGNGVLVATSGAWLLPENLLECLVLDATFSRHFPSEAYFAVLESANSHAHLQ